MLINYHISALDNSYYLVWEDNNVLYLSMCDDTKGVNYKETAKPYGYTVVDKHLKFTDTVMEKDYSYTCSLGNYYRDGSFYEGQIPDSEFFDAVCSFSDNVKKQVYRFHKDGTFELLNSESNDIILNGKYIQKKYGIIHFVAKENGKIAYNYCGAVFNGKLTFDAFVDASTMNKFIKSFDPKELYSDGSTVADIMGDIFSKFKK